MNDEENAANEVRNRGNEDAVPPANNNIDVSSLPELRSRQSRIPVPICFRNQTERLVDIYWVDFKGTCVLYKSLQPGKTVNINTFVAHPWIFRDNKSGARLVVNNSTVFMPKPYFQPAEANGPVCLRRVCYDVSIPIYTLKERAIQIVLSKIQSRSVLKTLMLPSTLLAELEKSAAALKDTKHL